MKTLVSIALALTVASGSGHAADTLALVQSDGASAFVTAAQTALKATGKFSQVDIVDARTSTPTLATLSGYTDILAWTNNFPADGTALGNVLADFYDLGGKHVTIATYALTNPGGISGRIAGGAYAALSDSGTFANPDGTLVSMVAGDPVFAGINLNSLTYYHDSGFANAVLAAGATLLATDGHGVYMMARSSNGVVDVNLYPGQGAGFPGVDNNDVFYSLLANTFSSVSKGPAPLSTCTGTTLTATGGISRIQLTWALATGTDHYNIYRSATSGGPYSLIGSSNATTPAYVDTSVVANTTYYYVMREATAANVETCQSNEAKATDAGDTIPPTTTITAAPAPNAKGWNNSNVTITLSAVDNPGGSGVYQIHYTLSGAQIGGNVTTGSMTAVSVTTEGTTTITYFSIDNARNQETPKTLTILLDKTAPIATATANPLPNAAGWNDTDVTVSFSGSDSGSGVSSCTAPISFTTSGAGQVAKGTCTDNAGNVSAPVMKTVNIDKWAPVIQGIPEPGSCFLWAPNNKFVQVATLTVSGADTFDVTGTSNQPPAPGQTDIVITGTGLRPRVIELRAERAGNGGSRIYTITAKASTSAGQSTVRQFTCTVPHDRGEERDKDSGTAAHHAGSDE